MGCSGAGVGVGVGCSNGRLAFCRTSSRSPRRSSSCPDPSASFSVPTSFGGVRAHVDDMQHPVGDGVGELPVGLYDVRLVDALLLDVRVREVGGGLWRTPVAAGRPRCPPASWQAAAPRPPRPPAASSRCGPSTRRGRARNPGADRRTRTRVASAARRRRPVPRPSSRAPPQPQEGARAPTECTRVSGRLWARMSPMRIALVSGTWPRIRIRASCGRRSTSREGCRRRDTACTCCPRGSPGQWGCLTASHDSRGGRRPATAAGRGGSARAAGAAMGDR